MQLMELLLFTKWRWWWFCADYDHRVQITLLTNHLWTVSQLGRRVRVQFLYLAWLLWLLLYLRPLCTKFVLNPTCLLHELLLILESFTVNQGLFHFIHLLFFFSKISSLVSIINLCICVLELRNYWNLLLKIWLAEVCTLCATQKTSAYWGKPILIVSTGNWIILKE